MSDAKKARCYDKEWRYVPKDATDVAKTWARVRRQMKEAEAAKQAEAASKQAARTANSKPPRVKERT